MDENVPAAQDRVPSPESRVPQLAFVFPGQGSQSVGMLAELAAAHPQVRATFDEASQGAGRDLWSLAQNGPEEELNRTENTQPALLAASVAVWRVWCELGGDRKSTRLNSSHPSISYAVF